MKSRDQMAMRAVRIPAPRQVPQYQADILPPLYFSARPTRGCSLS